MTVSEFAAEDGQGSPPFEDENITVTPVVLLPAENVLGATLCLPLRSLASVAPSALLVGLHSRFLVEHDAKRVRLASGPPRAEIPSLYGRSRAPSHGSTTPPRPSVDASAAAAAAAAAAADSTAAAADGAAAAATEVPVDDGRLRFAMDGQLQPDGAGPAAVVCYVVRMRPVPGKFDIAKAKALGVPAGPLYGTPHFSFSSDSLRGL
jgi:hypothetical protein